MPPSAPLFTPLPSPGATALVKLGTPSPDELGLAKSLALTEIGGTKCIVLQQVEGAFKVLGARGGRA